MYNVIRSNLFSTRFFTSFEGKDDAGGFRMKIQIAGENAAFLQASLMMYVIF